ncbi:hypothetical protein JANAI62_20100 [Jannaschia pagri]|uniref:DUF2267 domain-containing protein n=1 Tax=Jannaschia pagri TaxID=2829797 RepID=A0ABQ4NLW0_9RHOB|nr:MULTISPECIES: DUF2267 domain-containing protein [unclassified Jannaschia]GIT91553.1 hypothetical protein JANAI61_20110 [Jannaschia sp. AI_61]GIT95387.1 hypothetical protein JANAI62_20100 [Jannaschia sp. AI_62]
MSPQGPDTLDPTVRLTQDWVDELADRLGWSSRRATLLLLRTVLTELRARLPPGDMARLSGHLPLLLRGMFYEGWHPATPQVRDSASDGFERAVEARLGPLRGWRGQAEIAAVFSMLTVRLPSAEVRRLRRALPQTTRDFWPPDTRTPPHR